MDTERAWAVALVDNVAVGWEQQRTGCSEQGALISEVGPDPGEGLRSGMK